MADQLQQERDAFEAFARSEGFFGAHLRRHTADSGVYADPSIRAMWVGWAGRAARGDAIPGEVRAASAGAQGQWITGPTIPVPSGAQVKLTAQVRANPGEDPVFDSVKAEALPPAGAVFIECESYTIEDMLQAGFIGPGDFWDPAAPSEEESWAEYDSWFPIAAQTA